MNLKTILFKFLITFIVTIAFNSNRSLARIKPNQQQYNGNNQDYERSNAISRSQPQDENKFKLPFVVLMSSNEISVAQLPMIGYGNISVVYRLVVDDHDEAESSSSSSSPSSIATIAGSETSLKTNEKEKKKKIADVRDLEQMLKSPPSSLGKSERQQIAASNNQQEEVGKRRNFEDVPRAARSIDLGEGEEEELTRRTLFPRKKRSNSNSVTDAGNSLFATNDGTTTAAATAGISVNNNNRDSITISAPAVAAVQESSSVAIAEKNVTSASFTTNEQEEVVRRSRTEEANEDEPKNGAVQFTDFDVHMRLGLAFVADTRGRIHRFRLSGYSGDENLQSPENDYTNGIGMGSHDSSRPTKEVSHHHDFDDADDDDRSSSSSSTSPLLFVTNSDDANKVGGLLSVANEKFGRHPTASGAERRGFAENSNDGLSTWSDTVVDVAGLSSFETNHNKRSSTVINIAKPRIIWSRTKHGIVVAHHHQRETSAAVDGGGARVQPSQTGEQGALSSIYRDNHGDRMKNQMANDSEQMGGDSESEEPLFDQHHTINVSGAARHESTESSSSDDQTSESIINWHRSRGGNHEPSSEIAIDWLNNLLFVLDKYRLLVLDFDGRNELVLIDDFNQQPLNLKVDPINGFLFWLQVGKFHNTIYKLDLNVLEKYQNGSSHQAALISHHYAHPIVTNLPTHAKLFIIDHKHSRIYVPLSSRCAGKNQQDFNQTQHIDDAEIFSSPSDVANIITHMNSTSANMTPNELPIDMYAERNHSIVAESASGMQDGQILAYNLDGTDVGPLRSSKKSGHSYNYDDILDITLDTDQGFLYWLTNDGGDLFEEYQGGKDLLQAQHNLEGKKFKKLLHFNRGFNQHIGKPRFDLLKLFLNSASTTAADRLTRSDQYSDWTASSLNITDPSSKGFPRFMVFIFGGVIVASLFGIFVYFVSRPPLEHANHGDQHNGGSSSAGSFIGESHVDSIAHNSGFIGASTISRWITRPSTSSADTSTFHRSTSAKNEPLDSCDFESSTNYGRSNAIDDHYRDSIYDQQTIIQMEQNCLTNLAKWPSNMCEVSNRLYVPFEFQEDQALSSIHRVTMEQLNIEKKSPLGEGHFGTVLQGAITCTVHERDTMLNKSFNRNMRHYSRESREASQARALGIPSSGSSGHGSSSISSEFVTANSVAEAGNEDYLLPKSNTNSATSDYSIEDSHVTALGNYIPNPAYHSNVDLMKETKFKVAIKKLKDNASPKERSDFLQEAKHLAKFDHPNIVSLIGICLDRGSTLIIMELMLGGDLIRYMQENKPTMENQDKLTPDDLLAICLDIVSACCYLEEREHIHRDLAARNCLVSSRKREDRIVKLADFGLARDIYKDSYYKKLNDSAMPLKWMAPECFMEQKFTIKSDVWSFGVVMWEVMSYCQDKPYNNVEHFMMKDHLVQGLRLDRPEHCSQDVYRLMNECWQLDPNRRPTFEECRATLIEIKGSNS